MADKRLPGSIGKDHAVHAVDAGTMNRWRTHTPGPILSGPRVEEMTVQDRFVEVLKKTLPLLPNELQDEFGQLLNPTSLAILAGTLAIWAGSHAFGWGFVVDAILLVAGAAFLGLQIWTAASDFIEAVRLTASATSMRDLDEAALHMANFVAVVGVAAFAAIVMRGAKRVAPKVKTVVAGALASKFGGMTPAHFRIFQQVAQTMNRIIAVRNTNPKSTAWIERGFPPKPMEIKIKTSKTTGIVTATNSPEVQFARSKGYYVVDPDGVPRNMIKQELKFIKDPEWPMEPGQVIHPAQQRPLVGDYDLLGVINPESPGRNIVLAATKERGVLDDWTNPETKRIAQELNRRMGQPRVMHGAHDGKMDLPDSGAATVFFPDGTIRELTTPEEMAEFYRILGRQTITGKY